MVVGYLKDLPLWSFVHNEDDELTKSTYFYFIFSHLFDCDDHDAKGRPKMSERFASGAQNQDRFRSNFAEKLTTEQSEFFAFDESELLATLNSFTIADETPTPPPPPPPPLGLEKLQRSYMTGSKTSRSGKPGSSGNKRSIFRRLPSLTLLNFSSQHDSW